MTATEMEGSRNMLLNLNVRRQFFTIITALFLVQPLLFSSSSENSSQKVGLPLGEEYKKWYIYTVDEGGLSSIDIDSSCLPHISYTDRSSATLKYASWNQGAWARQIVDDRPGSGWSSSIVLDSADWPMIAYWNLLSHPDSYAVEMAYWNGVNWTLEVVDNETHAYLSIGLDLGSNQLPRISYIKWVSLDQMDLWFAEQNPVGAWSLEMIDSGGYARHSSLHIDSDDHYHISYEDMAANELRYAYWNGTNWSIEMVDSEDPTGLWSTGHWSSIKADRDKNPHIAYEGGKSSPLKYATKVSGLWQNTTIDYLGGPGLSMDLDSKMRPHISYQGTDLHLRHAWWNGSSWQIESVDTSSYVGVFSWLRIDGNDDIHISYSRLEFGNKTTLLKYATTKKLPVGGVETSIDIHPNTLNLKSKGNFITAHIELEGADVRDINVSSIKLNGAISPILDEKYGFVTSEDSYIVDHDNDGRRKMKVKFDRAEVQRILTPADEVVLTISGSLYDGRGFVGRDTIRVIDPP